MKLRKLVTFAATVTMATGATSLLDTGSAFASTAKKNTPSVKVVRTISAGAPTPHFIGVDQRTNRLFVSHLAQGTVTVIDPQDGRLVHTIYLGGTVHTVFVDQATQTVYVTDIARGLVDVINAKTYALKARINVGGVL